VAEPYQRILLLFAHPAIEKSRVNRELLAEARTLPGVTVRDLYEIYPDLIIDVRAEQSLLIEHDVVLLQHPFYWYSTPAILKEWMDLVLEYGFAYGDKGTALRGKSWVHAITTGGSEEAYTAEGANRFTMRELLAPLDQTATLCGMNFLEPFLLHGVLAYHSERDIPVARRAYRKFLETLTRTESGGHA
jgi:glutathione-regulated potassium-efflux system ancillary protein KefG